MSRMTSQVPERARSSMAEGEWPQQANWSGSAPISMGWLLASVAAVGVGAWMVYHFGPDLVRYMKMEKM